MIHDVCDYCRREFGRQQGAPAICMNCGLENHRPAVLTPQTPGPSRPIETAMLAPAESARKPHARRRPNLLETGIRRRA